MKRIIVVSGPTAVGKTALSIRMAKAIGGEIISADSMQVYRHMDIGSAKVTKEEMNGVPHYLIDVLEPTEEFNVARFKEMAEEAAAEIYSHGNIPIVAGGSGFYIQALLYDVDFKTETAEDGIREELECMEQEKGGAYLHAILEEIDPDAALAIHANNKKRIIRAIEYYRRTGERISSHNRNQREKTSPYDFLYYVLTDKRQTLYQRIDSRVDSMLQAGLVEEVMRLKKMGLTKTMVSMQGLGYKEVLDYLDGSLTLLEASDRIKQETRHFAKRQLTWFKRERNAKWIDLEQFGHDTDQVLQWLLCDISESYGWERTDEGNENEHR